MPLHRSGGAYPMTDQPNTPEGVAADAVSPSVTTEPDVASHSPSGVFSEADQ
jgi:hypothetical protein